MLKKKLRHAVLAAMVQLALTSNVMAMPTGANLIQGQVQGITQAVGGEMSGNTLATVNGPAIINWNAFNINFGELLNVNTASGALLNRVVGGNPSYLLGTLRQTGANPMYLINTNGIVVGPNATIDVNKLALSTLAVSDADFMRLANGGNANFVEDTTKGTVQFQNDAKISVNDLLLAYGGTVQVDDNVSITVGKSSDDWATVTLAAVNAASASHSGFGDVASDMKSDTSNKLIFNGNIDTTSSEVVRMDFVGGTTNVNDANFKLGDSSLLYVMALQDWSNKTSGINSADNANELFVNGIDVNGGSRVYLAGGTVDINSSSFHLSPNYGRLNNGVSVVTEAHSIPAFSVASGNKILWHYYRPYSFDKSYLISFADVLTGTSKNKSSVNSSHIVVPEGDIFLQGGQVAMDRSVVKAGGDAYSGRISIHATDQKTVIDEEAYLSEVAANSGNLVALKDSSLLAKGTLFVTGGNINLTGINEKSVNYVDIVEDTNKTSNSVDGYYYLGADAVSSFLNYKTILSPNSLIRYDYRDRKFKTLGVPGVTNQYRSIPTKEEYEAQRALERINNITNEITEEWKNESENNNITIGKIPKQPTLPTMSEKSTESERVFHVEPGYNREGYNVSGGGLYVYDLNVNNDPNVEKPVTFYLYNEINTPGYIEYYNENGNFIKGERIEPHTHVITSAEKWLDEAWKLYNSIKEHGLLNDVPVTDPYYSTKKKIEAPKGTRKIVVTNNPNASSYAQVSNIVDNAFKVYDIGSDVAGLFKDYKTDMTTINQILVAAKEKTVLKIMGEIVKPGVEKLTEEGIQNLIANTIADTLVQNGDKILFELDKAAAKQVVGEVLGANPGVWGYKAMMTVGKSLDALSAELTKTKVGNVRPMIFQLNY